MTQTNDKQRIVFQQGGPLDGDSGERGNDTAADGGVESVKPLNDGERAHQTVFRRPEDNLRRRTEVLRDAGEQQKYLEDQMRWSFTQGRDDGTALGPALQLGLISWNSTTGIFAIDQDVVLQPLNTPEADMQETVDYEFDGGTVTLSFILVPGAASAGRAYNGANLLNIVWEEVPIGDLASALVPNLCDIVISGDPDHIVTISIRNDSATSMSHVQTALITLGAPALSAIGLTTNIVGVLATILEYGDIVTPDYVFEKAFDRELHYIPTTSWDDFFTALGRGLNDGETVAIRWASYVDPYPAVDGRRQSIPSNVPVSNGTTVLGSQLFSTTEHPEWIPFSIPVCKRVGLDLWWLDGGVSYGVGAIIPTYMGEHGYTVYRIETGGATIPLAISEGWYTTDPPSWAAGAVPNTAINGILDDLSQVVSGGGGAQEISKSTYPDPGGAFDAWSQDPIWFASWEHVGTWLESLLLEVNRCPKLDASGPPERIFRTWYFDNLLHFSATKDDGGAAGTYDPFDDTTWAKPATFFDLYETDGNPDAFITRAYVGRVQQESSTVYTFNRPIRGFHCGAIWASAGQVVPNQLVIGDGDAYVRGRHVHLDAFLLTNVWDGVANKGGMTAATKVQLPLGGVPWFNVCAPLYVWLRADGTIHLDVFGVDFTGNYGELNDMHYKPHTDSGLVGGGWLDWDYTLIDVVWLIQGNTGGTGDSAIRMAGFMPLGGHYFGFERALYRATGGVYETLVPVIHHQNGSTSGEELLLDTKFVSSTEERWRSPGLPCVSNRGNFAIVAESVMDGSDRNRMSVSVGRVSGAAYEFFMPNLPIVDATYSMLPGGFGVDGPSVIFEDKTEIDSAHSHDYGTQAKHSVAPATVIRALVPSPPQMETRFDVNYTAGGSVDGTLKVVVHFLGFWWDKYAGPDVSDFRENPLA